MNNTTHTPVNKDQFCKAVLHGIIMLNTIEIEMACSFHFSIEYFDVVMMRRDDGNFVMCLFRDHKPTFFFDHDPTDGFWRLRGDATGLKWTKAEIYDHAIEYATTMSPQKGKGKGEGEAAK